LCNGRQVVVYKRLSIKLLEYFYFSKPCFILGSIRDYWF